MNDESAKPEADKADSLPDDSPKGTSDNAPVDPAPAQQFIAENHPSASGHAFSAQGQNTFHLYPPEKQEGGGRKKVANDTNFIAESEKFSRKLKEQGDGFEDQVTKLRQSNILLLGDKAHGRAANVAYALASAIEEFGNAENIRLYSLSSGRSDDETIQDLKLTREDPKDNLIVTIDASKYEGKFASSLFDYSDTFEEKFCSSLKDNKVFLICLIPSKYLRDWLNKRDGDQTGFPYWFISEEGSPSQPAEDENGSKELVGKLLDVSDEERKVLQTLLFVGAYYPDLPMSDFIDLVDLWLLDEDAVVFSTSSDPETGPKPTPKQLWNFDEDHYFAKCGFVPHQTEEGKTIVCLRLGLNGKGLRTTLMDNVPVAIRKKLRSIIKFGLVFHKSEAIAKRSKELFAKHFLDNEETNYNWFIYAFRLLETHENLDAEAEEVIISILGEIPQQYIRTREKDLTQKKFFYDRIAGIIREMLAYEQMTPVVVRIFNQLIAEGFYRSLFILVRQLQHSRSFDDYYWLRRLTDEGDEKLRKDIQAYILKNLLNNSAGIENIEDWFPSDHTENLSMANKASLKLLIQFIQETTQSLAEEFFHVEPTRLALFVNNDAPLIKSQVSFIIKYVSHPWIKDNWMSILREIFDIEEELVAVVLPFESFYSQTIERWCFILYIPKGKKSLSAPHNGGLAVTNDHIIDLILEGVVDNTEILEQEEIRQWWRLLRDDLEKQLSSGQSYSFSQRETILRHKIFVSKLDELFRKKTFQKRFKKKSEEK